VKSLADPQFHRLVANLPKSVQKLAGQKYRLFQQNPFHASLGLEAKGAVWTVEVGRSYRAAARRHGDTFVWFWIGSHEEYNNLLKRWR
jgi:hypothetical protein